MRCLWGFIQKPTCLPWDDVECSPALVWWSEIWPRTRFCLLELPKDTLGHPWKTRISTTMGAASRPNSPRTDDAGTWHPSSSIYADAKKKTQDQLKSLQSGQTFAFRELSGSQAEQLPVSSACWEMLGKYWEHISRLWLWPVLTGSDLLFSMST